MKIFTKVFKVLEQCCSERIWAGRMGDSIFAICGTGRRGFRNDRRERAGAKAGLGNGGIGAPSGSGIIAQE